MGSDPVPGWREDVRHAGRGQGRYPDFYAKAPAGLRSVLREQYPDIVPGYYMNKEHWNSLSLQGTVPDDLVREMVDRAYETVLRSLPKRVQRDIEEG